LKTTNKLPGTFHNLISIILWLIAGKFISANQSDSFTSRQVDQEVQKFAPNVFIILVKERIYPFETDKISTIILEVGKAICSWNKYNLFMLRDSLQENIITD